jgi:putative restriction endonuclease
MRGIAPHGSSIVLSGGYVDDEDLGDVIIYTGEGGRDPNTGRQVADQQLTLGNKALAENHLNGIPIRVHRGSSAEYAGGLSIPV